MEIPDEQQEIVEQLEAALADEPEVEVGTGPMGGEAPRNVGVDFADEVRYRTEDTPGHGPHVAIEVPLTLPPQQYEGHHGSAVYEVMDRVGIDRPDNTPYYGVQLNTDSGVTVTNYLPISEE